MLTLQSNGQETLVAMLIIACSPQADDSLVLIQSSCAPHARRGWKQSLHGRVQAGDIFVETDC